MTKPFKEDLHAHVATLACDNCHCMVGIKEALAQHPLMILLGLIAG